MEKYTVLVSHPLHGSTYITPKGTLTKDRFFGLTFDTVKEASKAAKKYERKLGIPCNWNIK